MRLRWILVVWAGLATLLAAETIDLKRITPVPAGEPIPIADFFRPPQLHSPVVNPTGTHLAALISPADKTELLMWDIAAGRAEGVTGYGDTDMVNVRWLDDRHVLCAMTTEKYFMFASLVATVGELKNAHPLFEFAGSRLIGLPPDDSAHPLFWLSNEWTDDGRKIKFIPGPVVEADALRPGSSLFVAPDLRSFTHSDLNRARDANLRHILRRYPTVPGLASGYLADNQGRLAFGFGTNDAGVTTLYRFDGGQWIPCPVDVSEVNVVDVGDLPGQLLVEGPRTPGRPRALQFLTAATGKYGDVLYRDEHYDFVGEIVRDRATRRIAGLKLYREGLTPIWFDGRYAKMQQALNQIFKGRQVDILSVDDPLSVIVAAVSTDRIPPCFYVIDLAHRQVSLLDKSRPWLDPARMSEMHILRYRARDGVDLDAYLSLPPGASPARPAPLIVYPHGAPFDRDAWGFDPAVQYLVSRGYAVLQPNYRISVGYEWRAAESDRWNFGKMTEDVSDAARAALKTRLIDPHRVAIVGGSFGGYLAVSGAAHDPSLYRCAVTIAGVFDWPEFIRNAKYDQEDHPQYAELKRFLGDPKNDRVHLAAMSPIHFIDQIKAPVFIYHGEDDRNVAIEQSYELDRALRLRGIPHETMFVMKEGHGPRHLDNVVAMWRRIETFLAKNLGE